MTRKEFWARAFGWRSQIGLTAKVCSEAADKDLFEYEKRWGDDLTEEQESKETDEQACRRIAEELWPGCEIDSPLGDCVTAEVKDDLSWAVVGTGMQPSADEVWRVLRRRLEAIAEAERDE